MRARLILIAALVSACAAPVGPPPSPPGPVSSDAVRDALTVIHRRARSTPIPRPLTPELLGVAGEVGALTLGAWAARRAARGGRVRFDPRWLRWIAPLLMTGGYAAVAWWVVPRRRGPPDLDHFFDLPEDEQLARAARDPALARRVIELGRAWDRSGGV